MTTGAFWNVTDPLKPWGPFDPNSELDIPFDWAAWLTGEGTTYVSHTIIPDPNLQSKATSQAAGVIKTRIAKAVAGTLVIGTKYPITCRIVDSAGQIEDQTIYLKIREK